MSKKLTANKEGKSTIIGGARSDELKEKIRSLEESAAVEIAIEEIICREPFRSKFRIKPETKQIITNNMLKNGFDRKNPILLWEHDGVLENVDGFTRIESAIEAELSTVWARKTGEFQSDDEVLEYMESLQFHRRNLDDLDLIRFALTFCHDKSRGSGRKKDQFASKYGLKPTKAQQILTVADKATDEDIQRIEDEDLSAYQAYKLVKDRDKTTEILENNSSSVNAVPEEETVQTTNNTTPSDTVEKKHNSKTYYSPEEEEEEDTLINSEINESESIPTKNILSEPSKPSTGGLSSLLENEPWKSEDPTGTPDIKLRDYQTTEPQSAEFAVDISEETELLYQKFIEYKDVQKRQSKNDVVDNLKRFAVTLYQLNFIDKDQVDYITENL